MYVVIKENHVGYDYGYHVPAVFGPFPDYAAAEVFQITKEAEGEYGQEYVIFELEKPE